MSRAVAKPLTPEQIEELRKRFGNNFGQIIRGDDRIGVENNPPDPFIHPEYPMKRGRDDTGARPLPQDLIDRGETSTGSEQTTQQPYLYRANNLSNFTKGNLEKLAKSAGTDIQSVLSYIDINSNLPQEIIDILPGQFTLPDGRVGFRLGTISEKDVKKIQEEIGSLPSRRDSIKKFLKTFPAKGFNATEEQINLQLQAYKDLDIENRSPASIEESRIERKQELVNRLTQKLNSISDIRDTDPNIVQGINTIAEMISRGETPDAGQVLGQYKGGLTNYNMGRLIAEMGASIGQELNRGDYYKGTPIEEDFSENIGLLQTQLEGIVGKKQAEQKIQDFLKELPSQQEQAINELDQALLGSQTSAFEKQFAPQILAQMNKRGLINSGSLEASLAEQAGALNLAREGAIAPLRAQAKLGTQQLQYGNLLRGALESGQSFSQATEFARQLLGQEKQNMFASNQAALNRQFQDEQMRQQLAFQQAMQGNRGSPSGMDYFLQYGLPAISSFIGPLSGFTPKPGVR